MAFVYVISTVRGGKRVAPVKIGLSSSVVKRLGTIQTASLHEVSLCIAFGPFTRETARRIEREAHRIHASCRLNGEWFDCEPSHAIWNVSAIVEVLCLAGDRIERAKLATRLGVAAAEMHASIALEEL